MRVSARRTGDPSSGPQEPDQSTSPSGSWLTRCGWHMPRTPRTALWSGHSLCARRAKLRAADVVLLALAAPSFGDRAHLDPVDLE